MSAETLLSLLKNVKQTGPGRWIACCPAHEDSSPSLSIRELDDGRILLNDFGACSNDAVVSALGLKLSDLFPAPIASHARPVEHAHVHAACAALRVMAREAIIVAVAAENLAAGVVLKLEDRERLLLAAERIHAASRAVQ